MRRALLLLAVLACASAAPAVAQQTTGTLVGTITDESGAVVPGVTIVAKHLDTGRSFEAVSTSTGVYTLQLLPVGDYEVAFQLAGFQTVTVKGISLHVSDRLEVNGKLSVSGLAEVVEVTAAQQLVQPTPALQNLIDSRQVQELPLNNRNFAQLATLAPGVSSDLEDEVGVGLTSRMNLSINGARRNAVNWLVDGVSNVDVGSNITLLSTPTLESIQEFKIITNGYAAEWPRSGGGIINVVTKSGSKRYTGNALLLHARREPERQLVRAEQEQDATLRGNPPALDYKNFGYTFGGPVPSMTEKLFFFWSQEWRRVTRAPASLIANVPDPSWLNDPTNINYVAPSLRDPNAVALLAAWPAPNVPGKNQYLVSSPNINNTRQEVIRMDYDFSPKWRLTGRYTHDLSQTRELGGLFLSIAVPNVATTDTNIPGQVFALGLKTILSNSALNEFSYQMSSNAITTTNPDGTKGMRSDYAINIPEIYAGNASNRIPTIAVTGLSSIASNQLYDNNYVNHTFTDNFSLQKGNHAFKAGLLMTFEQKNENAMNATQGSFSFVSVTGGRTGFQNFMLGNADGSCAACSYSEAERDVTNNLRFSRYEMYAQDTWKVQRNLTVDYGVRYALYPPVKDVNDQLVTFDPSTYVAANAPQFANATGTLVNYATGDPLVGLIVAGKNSPYGRAIYEFKKNSIQPRVGFSWDPQSTGNTILRGAFGIYYDQPLVGIFEQNSQTSPPIVSTISLTGIRLSNPGAGVTTSTSGVRAIQATATDFENPRMIQWNLTVTRRLFKNGVAEIGYVGSRGDNLIRPTDINYPQPTAVVALQSQPGLSAAVNPVRPYRSYGQILMRETTSISRYKGLLAAFRWNAVKNATLNLSYTLSRNQTDASNDRDSVDIPQNPLDPMADYADARTDRRHIFTASYIYEFPFFRDSTNAVLKHALGGWQFSGITAANSGPPVNRISVSTNNFRRGGFADLSGQPIQAGELDQWGTPNMWFNPAAFTPPADGTFGNSGRAPFRQPGFFKTDLTLSKNFYLPRNARLQFRADFINAFNQVNWQSDPSTNSIDNTCTTLVATCLAPTDTFGQLLNVRAAREIQLGFKLYW